MRIARWHMEGEAYEHTFSMVLEAQAELPAAALQNLFIAAYFRIEAVD
ncbi:MAG: hypothetical protein OXF56_23695 [Rhodobacteraceae bacterium]|nr:hypothetical protein [Paracoccaceae bacterium]